MGTTSRAFLLLALAGTVGATAAMSACVGDEGLPVVGDGAIGDGGLEASSPPPMEASSPPPMEASSPILKVNGASCAAGSECTSEQCSDGVCCDTKCDGICEKCSLPGTIGTCSPVPDGQDPETECPTTPLATGADAGIADSGADGDAGDGDAAAPDAGPAFNVPDSGLPPLTNNQCAGHCNGKRACAYAGTEVTCGTSFCGNTAEEGRASCDGAGHCLYGVEECSAYACPDGSPGCKITCAADTDCLAGFYCDSNSQACRPKIANGTACSSVAQCQSGVCDPAGHVCCNVDCSAIQGGTCTKAGAVGMCTCSACANGGACALFYRDADGDHYGDMNGTVMNGTAAYGCAKYSDGPPPMGFVADHTDCLDTTAVASSVNPGQAEFFADPYTNSAGNPSFDYNCSGRSEKYTADGVTTGCGTCHFDVLPEKAGPIPPPAAICMFDSTCDDSQVMTGHACNPNDCEADNSSVFTAPVPCGEQGSLSTCDPCDTGSGTSAPVDAGLGTQLCH